MHVFQKLAAVSADSPRLYGWGARALYLGRALNLSAHRNSVGVLAIGVEAGFDVAVDPRNAAAGYVRCRSAVIPPNTLHHLTGTDGLMAFFYVDPRSLDLDVLSRRCRLRTRRAGYHVEREDEIVGVLQDLAAQRVSWPEVRNDLAEILSFSGARRMDARIQRALDVLHANPGQRPSLETLARTAGLSPSRFTHLFKEATGVPVRRYKLWLAMGAALRSLKQDQSLTTAAHEGGFSSSAHFSSAFREMFGLEPSRLLKRPEKPLASRR
jgi:AraC-like DNA-binding protein